MSDLASTTFLKINLAQSEKKRWHKRTFVMLAVLFRTY